MIEVNKLYNEDCLLTMVNMDDNSVDMVLTSPPYDDLRTYNKHLTGNRTEYNGYSFPFEQIAQELFRVVKKGGVVVWVVGDATNKGSETGTSFRQALYFKECGFDLYDTMIYQKTGTPFPQKDRYNQTFEYMFVFSKGKPKTFNPIMKKNVTAGAVRHSRKFRTADGEMKPGFNGKPINEYGIENNIWLIKNGMNKSTKDLVAFEHPAIFPEELALKHIISWSNKGDLIYDPFMGSGTTAKASIQLDRNWIGSELDNNYCTICEKRLSSVTTQTQLFDDIITRESLKK
jgi:DNA modification methylase|tara:strand:+ start:1231 stop:2094 length:864 start_codon:yes stop_codon:yes gene_type:complete